MSETHSRGVPAPLSFLPGLWLSSKVTREPHSTAASCILYPAFLRLLRASRPPLLQPLTVHSLRPRLAPTLAPHHDSLGSPLSPPRPPVVRAEATAEGIKKLGRRLRARTPTPACCARRRSAVATKRSCGPYQVAAAGVPARPAPALSS